MLVGPLTLSTSFSDTDIVGSTIYTYQITALNGNRIEGSQSSPAVAAVLTLTSIEVPSVTEVRVSFSEELDEASAEVSGKYEIAGPTNVTVLSARLDSQDPSGGTVILTTTPLREQSAYQLTVTGVVALGGNTMSRTPQVIAVDVPDHTAPRITQVQLAGSAWSADFMAHLAATGLGSGGLSVPGGPQQLTTIPWSGIDRIIVHFSENVTVESGNLRLFGVNVPGYVFADFQYDAVSFVAIWTLPDSPRADNLLLDLSDRVKDNGGNPIDGNWQDGVSLFPSGNGIIETGDDFRIRINVLPGDASADGVVDRGDLVDVIHALGSSTARGPYDPRLDLNTDGQIDVSDLRVVLLRHGSTSPTGQPILRNTIPAVAPDVVFDRLGGGGAPQAVAVSEPTSRAANESPLVSSSDQPRSRRRAAVRRRAANDAAIAEEFSTESPALSRRVAGRRRRLRDV